VPVVGGERGRAFDLRDRPLAADDIASAIAGEDAPLAVRCAAPGPVHERVGVVEPSRSYPLRAVLAAAARERGLRASQNEELARVRDRLAALDLPPVSIAPERRAVAETDDATALEAQVATLRGQLEAARERGDDPEALAAARERAIADLAARRTERLAAEQSHDRARSAAQSARDRREERLQLEDRERNLERDARRELASAMAPAFERALAALPTDATTCDPPWNVDGPDAIGALAACRIAPVRAPIVVAGEWFDDATAATAALDAPVILVDE
jgi:hypothetical protein